MTVVAQKDASARARSMRQRLRERARELPMRPSLRITVLFAVAAVLLVPQALVYAWLAVERGYVAGMSGNARFSADEAAQAIAAAPGPLDAALSERLGAMARAHAVRLRVVDGAGAVLADFDHDRAVDWSQRIGELFLGDAGDATLEQFDAELGPLTERPEIAEARRTGHSSACRSTPEATLLVCHAAVAAGSSFVYAEDSSQRPMAHLTYLRFQLPRLMLVSLPFALLLGWWMGRRIVRPIEELRSQALAKVTEASPKADLVVPGGAETKDLAAAFNTLLAALEERRGANEAFVADLVHELKNPVATVRACGDALKDGPADAARSERLSRLLVDSSARLDALVSQLLELARAEAGMQHEPRTRVDLAALARGIATTMSEDARFAGVRFAIDAADGAWVTGVEHRFDSVVRNLVENAASFSGPEGEVRIEVASGPDVVTLRVSDTGPGIPPDDVAKVFGRFFTTRGRERGTGLGLALVRAIVEAHGGQVSAISSPGSGATFVVEVPRAS